MTNPNGRKGAETERMVAAYLREQEFWMADRRLREGRRDDQGDIDGIPYTTVQVKYVEVPRLQSWVIDTLKQRDNAGTPYALLVVRKKNKPVAAWDAYLPPLSIITGLILPEEEAWTWLRMDLRMAVAMLHKLIGIMNHTSPSGRSWSTTTSPSGDLIGEWFSAQLTESAEPASPTT